MAADVSAAVAGVRERLELAFAQCVDPVRAIRRIDAWQGATNNRLRQASPW
jgi:hypothetical protein